MSDEEMSSEDHRELTTAGRIRSVGWPAIAAIPFSPGIRLCMRVVDQNIDLFPPPRDENPAFLTRARKRPRPIYYRPVFAYFT